MRCQRILSSVPQGYIIHCHLVFMSLYPKAKYDQHQYLFVTVILNRLDMVLYVRHVIGRHPCLLKKLRTQSRRALPVLVWYYHKHFSIHLLFSCLCLPRDGGSILPLIWTIMHSHLAHLLLCWDSEMAVEWAVCCSSVFNPRLYSAVDRWWWERGWRSCFQEGDVRVLLICTCQSYLSFHLTLSLSLCVSSSTSSLIEDSSPLSDLGLVYWPLTPWSPRQLTYTVFLSLCSRPLSPLFPIGAIVHTLHRDTRVWPPSSICRLVHSLTPPLLS